jgi:hypothetical protein
MKGYAMGFEKGHESSGKSSKDSKLRKYMVFSLLVSGALLFTLSRGGLTGLIQRSTFDEVILLVNFTNFMLQQQLDY